MAPKLDSLLIASTDPQRLHDWYAAALAPVSDTEVDSYQVLEFDGFHMLIDRRDDVGVTSSEPGRIILNFDVDDAHAVAERIGSLGCGWVAPLQDRDGSLFATAVDPDGNHVQIIQLSEAHRRAMVKAG